MGSDSLYLIACLCLLSGLTLQVTNQIVSSINQAHKAIASMCTQVEKISQPFHISLISKLLKQIMFPISSSMYVSMMNLMNPCFMTSESNFYLTQPPSLNVWLILLTTVWWTKKG